VSTRLEAIDRDPGKIDLIINSHFHFDHVGGNALIPNLSSSEIDRSGITTAQENPDVLGGPWLITTQKKCCKGGSTSRFGDYPQGLP
jgi:glyoxylase-like metal-dependent hydrolase (beta-lactamase superfamily II)